MTVTPLPQPAEAGVDDETDHYFCCDEDTAVCGANISGTAFVAPEPSDRDCPLCVVLLEAGMPCPGCGP